MLEQLSFRSRALPLLAMLPLFGCAATVGVQGLIDVPSDGLQQCNAHCNEMGMETGAVVVMANNVGCVCQPPESTASTDDEKDAAALAGGMAAIAIQAKQQQQQASQ